MSVNTGHDFTEINKLMPHPVYAWMSWVCILSPDEDNHDLIFSLINDAYQKAVIKFKKRTM